MQIPPKLASDILLNARLDRQKRHTSNIFSIDKTIQKDPLNNTSCTTNHKRYLSAGKRASSDEKKTFQTTKDHVSSRSRSFIYKYNHDSDHNYDKNNNHNTDNNFLGVAKKTQNDKNSDIKSNGRSINSFSYFNKDPMGASHQIAYGKNRKKAYELFENFPTDNNDQESSFFFNKSKVSGAKHDEKLIDFEKTPKLLNKNTLEGLNKAPQTGDSYEKISSIFNKTSKNFGTYPLDVNHDKLALNLKCYKELMHNLDMNHVWVKCPNDYKAKIYSTINNKKNLFKKTRKFESCIKIVIDNLLNNIESTYYDQYLCTKVIEDQPFKNVLKDYSDMITEIILKLLENNFSYLAESIESLYKFFIQVIDKIVSIKEVYMQKIHNKNFKFLEKQISEEKMKCSEIEANFQNQIKSLEQKISKKKDRIKSVKQENMNLHKDIYDMNKKLNYGKNLNYEETFNNMELTWRMLEKNLSESVAENSKQTLMVSGQLLQLAQIASKKNKHPITVGTQTRITWAKNNLVVSKQGIKEYPVDEQAQLKFHQHPLLSYLIVDIKSMNYGKICPKMKINDSIEYLEAIFETISNMNIQDRSKQQHNNKKIALNLGSALIKGVNVAYKGDIPKKINIPNTDKKNKFSSERGISVRAGSHKVDLPSRSGFGQGSERQVNTEENSDDFAKKQQLEHEKDKDRKEILDEIKQDEKGIDRSVSNIFTEEVQKLNDNDIMVTSVRISEICQHLQELHNTGNKYPIICGQILGLFDQECFTFKTFQKLQNFKLWLTKASGFKKIDYKLLTQSLIKYDLITADIKSLCYKEGEYTKTKDTWSNRIFYDEFKNQLQLIANKNQFSDDKKSSDLQIGKNWDIKKSVSKKKIFWFEFIEEVSHQQNTTCVVEILANMNDMFINQDTENSGYISQKKIQNFIKQTFNMDTQLFEKNFSKFFKANGFRYSSFLRKIFTYTYPEVKKIQRIDYLSYVFAFLNTISKLDREMTMNKLINIDFSKHRTDNAEEFMR